FSSKPMWWLERAAACVVVKFHFSDHQTMVAAAIYVDFDLEIFPWNLVTSLAQSTTARGRPQQGELLRTQSNFAFFARSAAANLEGERNSFGFFSQANVTAARFVREITLRDRKMARAQ